ncbi:hypothetical protein GQ473_00605 [archaeon]|nr:hypothetical protein [archaeon]
MLDEKNSYVLNVLKPINDEYREQANNILNEFSDSDALKEIYLQFKEYNIDFIFGVYNINNAVLPTFYCHMPLMDDDGEVQKNKYIQSKNKLETWDADEFGVVDLISCATDFVAAVELAFVYDLLNKYNDVLDKFISDNSDMLTVEKYIISADNKSNIFTFLSNK